MLESFLQDFTPYKLLVAAIQTLILTVLGRAAIWLFKIHPRKEWAYWVIGFLLIFAITAATANKPDDRPDLVLAVEHIMVTEAPQFAGTLVLVVATVRNRGQASTAEGFKLTVRSPDGNVFEGNRQTIPRRANFRGPDGTEIWISSDDALERKASTLIPRGAHVRGLVAYLFDKLKYKDLTAKGVVFSLAIIDNWGRSSTVTVIPPEFTTKQEVRDFPGMKTQDEIRRPDVIPESK